MKEVNVLSLFSGIGAFEKALDRKGIGYNLVNNCEFDKYASKSWQKSRESERQNSRKSDRAKVGI